MPDITLEQANAALTAAIAVVAGLVLLFGTAEPETHADITPR